MNQQARSLRNFAIAVALCAAAGCRPGPDDRTTLGIGFTATGAYADPALFTATLKRTTVQSTIRGDDLDVLSRGAGYYTGSMDAIPLPVGSEVTVTVRIADASGPIAEVPVSWTTRKGWNYGVQAMVGSRRPQGFCVGVVNAMVLPQRGATGPDSLFVMQGGLPNGALC